MKYVWLVLCSAMLVMLGGCDNDCSRCSDSEPVYTVPETVVTGDTIEHHCDHGHCYSVIVHHAIPATVPAAYPPVAITVTDPNPVTSQDGGAPPAPPAIAATGGVTRAVLVGINRFKNPGAPPLQGCDNDATNIQAKAAATPAWGLLKPENTVLLEDEAATVAAVKAALVAAVAASKPGDKLIYWQSSHGATDTDPVTGELVDVVCCTDFDWSPEFELTSTDFKAIFGKLQPGVIVGWGSDSCHSGDLDKNVGKHKHPVRVKSPIMPEAVRVRVAKARAKGGKSRALNRDILNVAFMSGCKTDQTSADSSDENGVPCGAFTHYFLKDYDANAAVPVADFCGKVDADLAADGYDQTPVCGGSQCDKPWLGGK